MTIRNLYPTTAANGPLKVLPGTHRTWQVMPSAAVSPDSVLGDAGDVLGHAAALGACLLQV